LHIDIVTEFYAAFIDWLSMPKYGLGSVFVGSFLSATLLPFPSEAVVLGVVKLNPMLLWATVVVATIGNTLGGVVTWWMGYGAQVAASKISRSSLELKALSWLEKLGPKACILSWLPLIGDPICALAGWLKLPFWPCTAYMAIGKGLRYLVLAIATSFFI
jgi:membrane protein YqaA with SNARE-associated domain